MSTAANLRLIRIGPPEAAATTIMKALAKSPEEQFARTGDFSEAVGN